MTLNPARILSALINMKFIPSDVSPIVLPQNLNLPINFATVSNLKSYSGSYTPANDTQIIAELGVNDQCNFFLLICDQPFVLQLSNGAGMIIDNLCGQRFVYMGLQSSTTDYQNLTLNGAAAGPEVPMTQAVACNWTLIRGIAAIT